MSLFWGSLLLMSVIWLGWTFTSQNSCERVRRGALPVRAAFDLIGWAGKHWSDPASRLDWIAEGMEWDRSFQKFLAKQFYGEPEMCSAPPRFTEE